MIRTKLSEVTTRLRAKLRCLLNNFLYNRSHNWKMLSNWSTVLHL